MTDPTPCYTGSYQFTRDDYLALTTAMRPQDRGLTRIILAIGWVAIWVLAVGLESPDWQHFIAAFRHLVTFDDVPAFVYAMFVLGIGIIIFLPSLTLLRAMRLYSSFAIAEQVTDLRIDAEGISTSGANRRARIEWPLVRRVIITPKHLFCAISKREVLLLPKRAFTDADFAAVVALASAKVRAKPSTL